MKTDSKILTFFLLLTFILPLSLVASSHHSSHRYEVVNLTANTPSIAPNTDPNLVNPWGFIFDELGNLIVANNNSNLATSYTSRGTPLGFIINTVINPTGLVHNNSKRAFKIGSGSQVQPAQLLFATEAGTILGYNKYVDLNNAIIAVDRSTFNTVYKGLTLAKVDGHDFLYATDFHNGKVDMFDHNFNFVGSFTDDAIPVGFAPFNIRNIDGLLYVTYAKQKAPDNHDDLAGPGNGFVDIFTPGGQLVKRLISQGHLNSPWGITLAPENFGKYSSALLIGNFGDGHIHAYHHKSGKFIGTLRNDLKQAIVIDGLWSLQFQPQKKDKKHARLYFTSGPDEESNGLLGFIRTLP